MLHLAFLLLAQGAGADVPVIKAELKNIAAEGKLGPALLCEGTSNLPDGAFLQVYVYYGLAIDGKTLSKDSIAVRQGKFSQDFSAFPRKNLAGKYILQIIYNPELQNPAIPGFKETTVESAFQFGTPDDFERESKAVRDQLVGEIRALMAMGDEVKAKIEELKGKPASAWEELLKGWRDKSADVMVRADPRKVPEYTVLNLDLVATSGMENLSGILISAAKHAAAGLGQDALEGLSRLRQTAEYWTSEIASPRLNTPRELVGAIESARDLIREALGNPDKPVLPSRRRFVEMNSVLQRSLPEDFQPAILEIGTRSIEFFNALADKEPAAKEIHAQLDRLLQKLADSLRPPK